jgi:hypothetical protein
MPRAGLEVLDGLDVSRVHQLLAVGPHVLHANLLHRGQEWPVARRTARVYIWMTGFEIATPVEWSGLEREGDYDTVGFWDEQARGELVLSASLGRSAHLGSDDRVMIAAGHLYGH